MSIAVGKIKIKIGDRDVEVNSVNINRGTRTITVFCTDESYNIFEAWSKIFQAHKQSPDYSKRNVCKDIIDESIKFCNCWISGIDEDYNKITISYDYEEVKKEYINPLDADETKCEIEKLFGKTITD